MSNQAILYARFSPQKKPPKGSNGEPPQEKESVEWQLERLRDLAKALNLPLAPNGEYWDKYKSGASMGPKNRPGLDAALAHVCKIRGWLLVYDWSRLSRDPPDALNILRRLRKAKVGLRSILDGQATDTADGDLLFVIKSGVNQYTRRVTAEKTSDSMRRHQYSGARRMSRPDRCPFGYRPVNGKGLEEDVDEQRTIARIVALDGEGLSLRQICARLDQEGISRRGRRWAGAQRLVSAILQRAGAS